MVQLLVTRADYFLTSWIFLRCLGFVYLVAFLSYFVQVAGLVGKQGVLPASDFLAAVHKLLKNKSYLYYPTLAWLSASDRSLKIQCMAGVVLAALLLLGIQTTPVLLLLYVLYLSLVTVGQTFWSFQWDALLLETGFLSIFLVPPSFLPGQALSPPSFLVILLFRWLLFRLMFMSGVVKLASRDPSWRNLTAMVYHYRTQPLPTPLAWYMNQAPLWFQKVSTLFSLGVELIIPFFYFGPFPLRILGAIFTIFLQLLIAFTGNFAFFNLLTIMLTVFLLDDHIFQRLLPSQILALAPSSTTVPAAPAGWQIIIYLVVVIFLLVGGVFILLALVRKRSLSTSFQPVLQVISAFRLVNSYGLFAVMTTRRPEIIFEGSQDGQAWLPYEFKFKPGNLKRHPPITAPYHPRLDWQMWFAALGSYEDNPWFLHLAERLLEGSNEVLALLESNPFPERPPRFVRAVLYDYRFTTPSEKSQTDDWWSREQLGLYLPAVSLPE